MNPFNPNRVCEDYHIWADPKHPAPSALDLQRLFERHKSGLATYRVEGLLCSEFLAQVCLHRGIDPRGLVARLQTEQSLVTLPHASEHSLNWAAGFGATDGGRIGKYAGFAVQVRSYCNWLRARRPEFTAKIGQPFHTSDGHTVHPQNAATWGLYTYTPWVGDKDFGGNKALFGNNLYHVALTLYFGGI